MAEKLFGKENLKQSGLVNYKSPFPLVLYCKNRTEHGFSGIDIEGHSTKFCNSFYPTPTDIGMCMSQNLNVGNILHLGQDRSKFMESQNNDGEFFMDDDNELSESVFILQKDILTTSKQVI